MITKALLAVGFAGTLMAAEPVTLAEVAKLKMPVLILQGDTDIQVQVADARLLAAAQPAAKRVIVNGMNHVLKLVEAGQAEQIASYSDPALPFAPRLIAEIVGFVKMIPEEIKR